MLKTKSVAISSALQAPGKKMKGNDKKGRSGRTKFSETDKRILQGQAVKEGDVETKPGEKKGDGFKDERESKTRSVEDAGVRR